MLSSGMGETHVSRFLSTLGVSPPSTNCLREREREVGHATENLAADSCKDAIREEINLTLHTDSSQPSSPFDKNENHVTDIAGSIDAAWQCRGSDRSYRSLSGHSSIIGEKSGKVLKFATRKKSCRYCDTADRSGWPAPDHDCRKNWSGSAKGMESSMAVELLKEEAGDRFRIAQVTSDLDSTLDADHTKKEIGRAIKRKLDQNHVTKTMSTHLHDLKGKHKKLTPTVIGYLAMCFSYAKAQNKDDVKKWKRESTISHSMHLVITTTAKNGVGTWQIQIIISIKHFHMAKI